MAIPFAAKRDFSDSIKGYGEANLVTKATKEFYGTSSITFGQQPELFRPTEYVTVKEELLKDLSQMREVVMDINTRIEILENTVSEIDQKLSEIMNDSTKEAIEESVEIPKEEAKKAILKLIGRQKQIDYEMIVSQLGLDLKLAVDICTELEKDKIIEEVK